MRRSWSKSKEAARGGVCSEYTSPMAESKLMQEDATEELPLQCLDLAPLLEDFRE